jgi:hypothetical protein
LNALLFVVFAIEGDADANASVVLYCLSWLIVIVVICALVCLSLDDKTATTSWDEALEDGGELLGDLFECTFYRLIFALIKHLDQLFD